MLNIKLFFVVFSLTFYGHGKKQTLVGEWKPVKVTFTDVATRQKTVLFDIENNDEIFEQQFRGYLARNYDVSELPGVDTAAERKKFRTQFDKGEKAKLIFNGDSTFLAESYGLIFPQMLPGWHFGDTLSGKWTQHQNQVRITIGNSRINKQFFFNIEKLDSMRLILSERLIPEGEVYKTTEFRRQ